MDPACFSRPPEPVLSPSLRQRHVPVRQGPAHAFNAPTQPWLRHCGRSPAAFGAPKPDGNPGQNSPSPAASPGVAECQSGTLLGATGGTQTHSRRTGWKLGQVRDARQGLVRVPESNTKYGGKRGITGDGAAPVMGSSISESKRIPKRKKFAAGVSTRLGPAVHRASIFGSLRIAFWRLGGCGGDSPGSHAGTPVAVAKKSGQGGLCESLLRRIP